MPSADPPLRLSGSPSSLRAATPTPDMPSSPARLVDVTSAAGDTLAARSASVVGGQMKLRLDPATPAGRYHGGIDIAGEVRTVEIDVVETVALQLRPASLMIDLAAGLERKVATAVANRGNVALTIDLTGDYPLGEEVPLLRDPSPADAGGVSRLVDLFAQAGAPRARFVLREAGRVTLAMPDGAFRLEPGETRTLSVAVAFPAALSPTARYRAFIPLFGEDLELVAVTAAKRAPRHAPKQGG